MTPESLLAAHLPAQHVPLLALLFAPSHASRAFASAFIDAYPGGHIPVLAPISWDAERWPSVTLVDGAWGQTYPSSYVLLPPRDVDPPTGTSDFSGTALSLQWGWNHNLDNEKWALDGGLRLQWQRWQAT